MKKPIKTTYPMPMPFRNREGVKIEDLEIGKAYEIFGRNISIGIWDGTNFHGIRYKFGDEFMDCETHAAYGPPHGTAVAIRRLK